jgi:acetyl-CoA carboxylase biotin carboxylase subunit
LRIDTHCRAGTEIPPYYDSMIGKVIAHADSREAAIEVLETALSAFTVSGIKTNLALHQRLLGDPVIRRGGMDIHYLEKLLEQGK